MDNNQERKFDALFCNWLMYFERLSYSTCRCYCSALRSAELFAQKKGFVPFGLRTFDCGLVVDSLSKIIEDDDFLRLNQNSHNQYTAAFQKLVKFFKGYQSGEITEEWLARLEKRGTGFSDETNSQIEALLKSSFPYGIRLSSARDIMRFRIAAEEARVDLPQDDNALRELLVSCGYIVDDKVFAKDGSVEDELREIINRIFESGYSLIYYESLFYAEQEWMERHHICSEDALKAVLKRDLREYTYTRVFFAQNEKKTEFDALSEELKRYWGDDAIASIDDLSNKLPFVPYENIQRVLFAVSCFVWASEGYYLLVDRLLVSDQEVSDIIDFVTCSCQDHGFASLTEIPLGAILENNPFLTGNVVYVAIYNRFLKDRFKNNGKILTSGNNTLSIVSILSREFSGRNSITFDEVNNRVTELNGGTKRQDAFEFLYDNYIRINEDLFVSPDSIHFDLDEIDRILSEVYLNGFGSIRDVITFAMFPVCGASWNHFVLESFCYRFSKRFKLFVLNFNSRNAGIIAEKSLHYSYDQMLVKALAESNIDLNEHSAGDYLFQRGMLAKRTYSRLNIIIQEAQRIRQEK